jgi:hypothetical protein
VQPPAAVGPGVTVDPAVAALLREMGMHFNRAEEALKQGNLALYAEEHKRARAVLDKLEKMLEKGKK